jgi:hypothetical protein
MDTQEMRFLPAEVDELQAEVVRGAVGPLFKGAVKKDLAGDALRRPEEAADLLEGHPRGEFAPEVFPLPRRQFPGGAGGDFLSSAVHVSGEGGAQSEQDGQGQDGANGRVHGRPRRAAAWATMIP